MLLKKSLLALVTLSLATFAVGCQEDGGGGTDDGGAGAGGGGAGGGGAGGGGAGGGGAGGGGAGGNGNEGGVGGGGPGGEGGGGVGGGPGGEGGGGEGGGGPAGTTCLQILQCTNTCADQACFDACLDDGLPAAQDQFFDFIECVETNCPDFEAECQQEQCGEQLNACTGGGNQPGGDLSCLEINECLGECGEDDQACVQGCLDSASQEGYDQLFDVIECIDTNCETFEDAACQQEFCSAELNACFQSVTPSGDGTCGDLFECAEPCGDDNQECINACIEATSPEGFADVQAFLTCAQDNACTDEASGQIDQACVEANCGAESVACFGETPVPAGEGTCEELFECAGTCEDQSCAAACIVASSQEGFDAAIAFETCIEGAAACEALEGLEAELCYEDACTTEFEACFGPSPVPAGDATCADTVGCLETCEGGAPEALDACADACIVAASEASFTQLRELTFCFAENECEGVPCPPCDAEILACGIVGEEPVPTPEP